MATQVSDRINWQGVILHRLESDAIPGVLADTFDEYQDTDATREVCERLQSLVEAGRLPVNPSPLECEILADCIDGSTWMGCAGDEYACGGTSARLASMTAAAHDAARRVSACIGRDVEAVLN